MAFKCGIVCDEEKVCRLLKDAASDLDKYKQARLQSYIEDNSNVRFCPSVPWCGQAVQVSYGWRLRLSAAAGHRMELRAD